MKENRYNQRGVSADKEDVHNAIKNMDKGLFPKAFCKIVPDYLSNDEGEFVFTLKTDDDNEITPTMRVVEDMASIDKYGTLVINSIPSQARVFLDNKYLGDTPFEETVPQGQYLFKVEKENYEPEITLISVRNNIERNA